MESPKVQSIMDSIRRIVRGISIFSKQTESSLGVSGAQFFVLQKLADGNSYSLNQLAELTVTHQSSVSVVVAKLVGKGLVSRQPSKVDGRKLELKITPKGKKIFEIDCEPIQIRMIKAIAEMDDQKRNLLDELLTEFTERARLSNEPPTLFFEE